MNIDSLKHCPFCGESALLAVRPIHNYAEVIPTIIISGVLALVAMLIFIVVSTWGD